MGFLFQSYLYHHVTATPYHQKLRVLRRSVYSCVFTCISEILCALISIMDTCVSTFLQHTVSISEETDDMELVNSADIGSLSHPLSCLPLAEGQLHC